MTRKIFTPLVVVPIIVVIAIIGGYVLIGQKEDIRTTETAGQDVTGDPVSSLSDDSQENSKPPNCPERFVLALPIDIAKVTSVLYPGQVRSNDFKAHGGFRFDGLPNDAITVSAPMDARVIAGARYPANGGEIQYTFDFENECRIRYRFHHLLTLTPKFQAIADTFPLPEVTDSRVTFLASPVAVKKGEIIATAVGMTTGGPGIYGGRNVFVDWGVYDHRQQNEVSQMADWPTRYSAENPGWSQEYNSETYKYAVCWFDWISPEDKMKVLALPSGDGEHGKQSDYCR